MKNLLLKTSIVLVFLFISIVNCKAQTWAWAKSAIGTSPSEAYAISVDPSGNAFITGYFMSSSIAFGTYTLTGSADAIYLAKYNSVGNLQWAKGATAVEMLWDTGCARTQ
jgi:hypothetical protein